MAPNVPTYGWATRIMPLNRHSARIPPLNFDGSQFPQESCPRKHPRGSLERIAPLSPCCRCSGRSIRCGSSFEVFLGRGQLDGCRAGATHRHPAANRGSQGDSPRAGRRAGYRAGRHGQDRPPGPALRASVAPVAGRRLGRSSNTASWSTQSSRLLRRSCRPAASRRRPSKRPGRGRCRSR